MVLTTRERVVLAQTDICAAYLERADVVRVLTVGFLAESNVLLLGSPGTAKSALVRALASHVSDARFAERLLSRFTVKEDLLGAIKVSGLRDRDVYERNMSGTPGDSDIVFLDETFRASGAVLDLTLNMLNERTVDGKALPLKFCVGASNFGAKDDYLDALDDRLLLRVIVESIQEVNNFDKYLEQAADANRSGYVALPEHTITREEWRQASQECRKVGLTPGVRGELAKLRTKCATAKIHVSDRRWGALVRILQANAWLDGCSVIESDHLDILRHGLWRKIEDRSAVQTMINLLDSGDVKFMADQGDTFLRRCLDWQSAVPLAKDKQTSEIAAERDTIRAAIKTKMASTTARGKAKGLEVLGRIDGGYLPVMHHMFRMMGVPVAMATAKLAEVAAADGRPPG